jgi:hypothetical protein
LIRHRCSFGRRSARGVAAGSVVLASLIGLAVAAVSASASPPPGITAGPPSGIVYAHAHSAAPHRSSPNLTYHGGPVMTTGAAVTAIYWGTSWGDSAFVGDKISGLGQFYGGIGTSTYAGTTTEYTDSSGGHVSSAVSYGGDLVDTSAAPSHAPQTSTILQEVANEIGNPVANGYYPVYVDTPRGHTGYCAWHSWGTVKGVVVQFAFFFNLDGDPGCDPQSSVSSESQGLAALANVSGHELSESLTDPNLNAWYDSSGAENADKCAWTFGAKPLTFTDHTQWKVQGNWSNAAYDANRGYTDPSSGFVRGCIDGTN